MTRYISGGWSSKSSGSGGWSKGGGGGGGLKSRVKQSSDKLLIFEYFF